ncbi:MAG: PhoH family protein [Bacteroidales bacterium]|nr:PhoH family protein [Bacteroidales bacterium]
MMAKKTFILDTNVILHDYSSLLQFEDNDVVIPITVLEELDNFKKGSEEINYHAREFMRELDKLAGDKLFNGGIELGEGKGLLKIELGKPYSEEMKVSFSEDKPDHRILAVADYYKRTFPEKNVVLVSKDINLRMKAKSLGIKAEDYKSDKVKNIEEFQREVNLYENIDDKLISRMYQEENGIPLTEMKLEPKPGMNSFFILKGSTSSALAKFNHVEETIIKVNKKTAYGIKPRNAEQTFAMEALLDDKIKLISLTGKAGTGKTLLALAAAIEQHRLYEQILLARPIVALSNRDIGYLPGDASEKINPYMQPLFDNLSVIKHTFNPRSNEYQMIEEMIKEERLNITPLAFIRGRSLSNAFFIIDEAQNLTPHEIKTIITRAGEGTKMIFTGDLQQIDSPYLDMKSNGLAYMTDKMRNQDVFAHINLVKGERSPLAELASNLL